MTTPATLSASPRPHPRPRRSFPSPVEAGLPDPRPLTEYAAVLSTFHGNDRLTITLSQPCAIREPKWSLIDCQAGAPVYPVSITVIDNVTFRMDFAGALAGSVAFVLVPYQDTQVQNFQGGFVRPGGQWFRAPVMP